MPSAQISSYTAHVGRLGVLGPECLLVISHTVVIDDQRIDASSEIYFADRFGETESGYTTLGADTKVRAHLPASHYPLWLDLLRHEAPVYLHWTVAEGEAPEPDGIIHLATGPEPPGEGPTDHSP